MALLNVGTGKTYATIQGAITAVDNGGAVQVHAGGVANAYAEALLVNNKRVRLYGALPKMGVSVTGAGAGVAPALLVSGTGGCFLENLAFSNVGSAATYVVQLNVAYDWIARCAIDGGGTARCLSAQFGENVLVKNGTYGVDPSCAGQTIFSHFTCVNMVTRGIASNFNLGEFIACLAYNCNSQGFVNPAAGYSWGCGADDLTPSILPVSLNNLSLAQIAFLNYAGGDFRLDKDSLAYAWGISTLAIDGLGAKRLRTGDDCRVFMGYHDPQQSGGRNEDVLAWITGASSIRKY